MINLSQLWQFTSCWCPFIFSIFLNVYRFQVHGTRKGHTYLELSCYKIIARFVNNSYLTFILYWMQLHNSIQMIKLLAWCNLLYHNAHSEFIWQLESIPSMVQGVWSNDTNAQLEATTQFRKLLSIGTIYESPYSLSILDYIFMPMTSPSCRTKPANWWGD